jgi:hypothetical protein
MKVGTDHNDRYNDGSLREGSNSASPPYQSLVTSVTRLLRKCHRKTSTHKMLTNHTAFFLSKLPFPVEVLLIENTYFHLKVKINIQIQNSGTQ